MIVSGLGATLVTHRRGAVEAWLGLGLWIANRMVQAHGGHITVASAPGAGATFTVVLPRSAP